MCVLFYIDIYTVSVVILKKKLMCIATRTNQIPANNLITSRVQTSQTKLGDLKCRKTLKLDALIFSWEVLRVFLLL